jgi:aryl-alcohol dehydrogenase-like predicted oxidoreductase
VAALGTVAGMEHVRFGRTGLRVSRLCLGTMTFGYQCDEPASVAILDAAAEAGITFLDTADAYPLGAPLTELGRTEEILGRWLKGRRDRFILATKCFFPTGPSMWDGGSSRQNIMRAIDESLRRLQTDHIDLYQLHFWDVHTPIDESLLALDDLIHTGKVRYIGISNLLAYQLARSLGRSEVLRVARFDSLQPRYNLLFRQPERELLPLAAEEQIAVIPYNALAGGLLTGKHATGSEPAEGTRFTLGSAAKTYTERYWHERELATVDALRPIADEAGRTMAEMAIAWMLANPVITSPIVGASRPEQLDAAVKAVGAPLDPDLKATLDDLTTEYRYGDAYR